MRAIIKRSYTVICSLSNYAFKLTTGITNQIIVPFYCSDGANSTTVTAIVDHNTITVADATGFSAGEKITTVNFSSLPDIGAFQYIGEEVNLYPEVQIDSPSGTQVIEEGDSLSFTCTASDIDGTIASYLWHFDGAGIADDASEDPGSKTFSTAGDYTVTVTVTDNEGGIGTANVLVRVTTPGGSEECEQGDYSTSDECDDTANAWFLRLFLR